MMTERRVACGECGLVLEERWDLPADQRRPCPKCRSTRRTHFIAVEDTIQQLHEQSRYWHKRPGYRRPLAEGLSGDDFSRSDGRWMKKERLVDRQNDRYFERVVDPSTGEVVHYTDHRLGDHRGFGSAKEKTRVTKEATDEATGPEAR